jgi:hypothetical protein
MAKKKTNKKTKTKRAKKTAGKKTAGKKRIAAPRKAAKKRSAKKSPKRSPARKKSASKKTAARPVRAKRAPRGSQSFDSEMPDLLTRRSRSGEQSGDLQGLSRDESADSESVDELLEEGNAFEAGIVDGVESAGRSEGREVRTREVPEDDVPDEYLDEE